MLATHPSVPAKTVNDLVALAKARKGQMNGASSGSGTTSHMSVEMLKQMTDIQVTHVPYNGAAPATIALISGEVDFIFSNMLSVYPQVKAGRLRALAVTTLKRSSAAPEVPAMAEFVPGFESDNWYGFFVPAGTPNEIIVRLNSEALKALQSAEVLDAMRKDGAEPVGSTPGELAAKLRREVDRYTKIIKSARIRSD
jgi:tripartite-type tricarboxylate transporter receptor subunit TctC